MYLQLCRYSRNILTNTNSLSIIQVALKWLVVLDVRNQHVGKRCLKGCATESSFLCVSPYVNMNICKITIIMFLFYSTLFQVDLGCFLITGEARSTNRLLLALRTATGKSFHNPMYFHLQICFTQLLYKKSER